ncbi:MAG: hypothetical protein KIT15_01875 [Xanthobacteraceae bacterium]|nr:hypothetical protein [Xanthobacteraceae bacterium]MBX3522550.1 hypothetical protein [Xanthobacteraceae bacterium]MCW5673302.1 hypothetical protein [Xanthobacteraceae bacterium]
MNARSLAKFLLVPALLAGGGFAGYAQERFSENPIKEGAWVYPTEKIAPAIIEAFCQSGFSVHFADGGFFTVLNQPIARMKKKLSVDTSGACTFNAEKQTSTCTGTETDGRRKFALNEENIFERDGTYLKVTTSFIDRDTKEKVTLVTYPMRCPDKVVREILIKAIPPK